MKKLMGILLAASMVFSLAACGSTADTAASSAAGTTATAEGSSNNQAPDVKVGAIILGDETEGYSAAHINGIKEAAAELGMSDDQIVWKYKIPEGGKTADAAEDLVGQGCNLIISNSYGHQTYMEEEAEKHPDVNFVAMTGDFAAISRLDNFYNAFTAVYQSRYVSGVVAGMKVKELVESGTLTPETQPDSFTADGKVKIGYVGAYNYAEVVSGYTAFFLGVQSVYPNVAMEVMYTNSWFDIDKEGAAAEALIANGSVIIGQHADSTGAPAAVQKLQDAAQQRFAVRVRRVKILKIHGHIAAADHADVGDLVGREAVALHQRLLALQNLQRLFAGALLYSAAADGADCMPVGEDGHFYARAARRGAGRGENAAQHDALALRERLQHGCEQLFHSRSSILIVRIPSRLICGR